MPYSRPEDKYKGAPGVFSIVEWLWEYIFSCSNTSHDDLNLARMRCSKEQPILLNPSWIPTRLDQIFRLNLHSIKHLASTWMSSNGMKHPTTHSDSNVSQWPCRPPGHYLHPTQFWNVRKYIIPAAISCLSYIKGFEWSSLPTNSHVVDVGGGTGSIAFIISKNFDLRVTVQDRAAVLNQAKEVCILPIVHDCDGNISIYDWYSSRSIGTRTFSRCRSRDPLSFKVI